MKIIIVDDCKGVKDVISKILRTSFDCEHNNIQVDTATKVSLSKLASYDLIIIDEVLTYTTGSKLIHNMCKVIEPKNIPCVIFITGFPEHILQGRLEKLGLTTLTYSIVEKPFSIEELYKAIEYVCPEIAKHIKCRYKTIGWFQAIKAALLGSKITTECEDEE